MTHCVKKWVLYRSIQEHYSGAFIWALLRFSAQPLSPPPLELRSWDPSRIIVQRKDVENVGQLKEIGERRGEMKTMLAILFLSDFNFWMISRNPSCDCDSRIICCNWSEIFLLFSALHAFMTDHLLTYWELSLFKLLKLGCNSWSWFSVIIQL